MSEPTFVEPPPRRGFLSSPAGKIVRALAGAAVLVLVVRKVPLHDLGERIAHVRAIDAVVLVVLALLQFSTGAVRWWRLFRRLDERPSFGAVYRDLLVGALFNTFLPTNVGGDVIRALRASRRIQEGHRAWSSSLFERLVGMLTLAMVGAVAAVFAVGEALPVRARIVVVAVTLVLGLGFFFIATPLRILVGFLEKRLPSAFIADVRGVIADLEGPLATTPARIETFAWSVVGFFLGIALTSFGATALGAPGQTLAILVGIPIISVLALAPISIGGHGLREGLFVVVLGALGIPRDVALGLALLALTTYIVFALAGGIVLLFEPTTAGAPPRREPS